MFWCPYCWLWISKCRWGSGYHLFDSQFMKAVARRCSVKKSGLRNFAKFTGKHLCQSFFFNKVADLRPETLLKKRLWHRCFTLNFVKFLRTPFLTEYSGGCFCSNRELEKEDAEDGTKYEFLVFVGYLKKIGFQLLWIPSNMFTKLLRQLWVNTRIVLKETQKTLSNNKITKTWNCRYQ